MSPGSAQSSRETSVAYGPGDVLPAGRVLLIGHIDPYSDEADRLLDGFTLEPLGFRRILPNYWSRLRGSVAPAIPPDPACPGCGMTSQVEPSRSEPGRWMCHGCAQTFDAPTVTKSGRSPHNRETTRTEEL